MRSNLELGVRNDSSPLIAVLFGKAGGPPWKQHMRGGKLSEPMRRNNSETYCSAEKDCDFVSDDAAAAEDLEAIAKARAEFAVGESVPMDEIDWE